ncbi:hypothetical protein D3C76_1471130 [compost metagenome]
MLYLPARQIGIDQYIPCRDECRPWPIHHHQAAFDSRDCRTLLLHGLIGKKLRHFVAGQHAKDPVICQITLDHRVDMAFIIFGLLCVQRQSG